MKISVSLAASAALLALSPVNATLAAPAKSAASEVPSQLPRNAAPLHYSITVTPDAEKLSFDGNVLIEFLLKTPSDSITLNAADIDFRRVTVAKGRAAAMPATAKVNAAAQTATISFGKKLAAGRYTLNIDYSGKILQQANGLFALDYKNPQGVEKRALFTQFEAPDARRFVPSWDEPNYKATFDLTATVPADQMAVSNMPVAARRDIGNGLAEVRFGTSPKMSTYLLFFGSGEFDRITKQVGPTEVGVIVGKGNGPKGQYALDASAKLVAYYNDYFGTPYPLPKLDNVAGPGQSQFFSAMENWGAIFTFERVLLNDPKITSARTRQGIFSTDAHEIAHQWFGNLVTMAWWDDLWLNEGFASWMESKATAHFNPDWQSELDRVNGREGAMGLDAYVTTHPVIQKISTVEQTSQAFDTITYQKGEAVITMLEAFAGETIWRDGLRAYMKKHAYANTRTDDLWNAVEAAGAKGLVKIAHDFTKQPGVPLLEVKSSKCVNGSTLLTLTQSEFSRDRKAETSAKPQRWNVPVIAQVIGQAPSKTVISNGNGTLQLPGCGAFIVNAGQSGYYRVLYQPDMMAALQKDFAKLPVIDQLGLLNDGQSLAFNEYQPVRMALNLMDAVPSDTSQRVTEDIVSTYSYLYGLYEKDPARQAKLAKLASNRFGPALAKLGYKQSPSDSTLDANLRSALISTLGYMGDPAVVAEAKRLFAELETDPAALDGPLRTTWLGVIAQNANQADWDKMRKLGQTAENFLVRSSMYRLLGSARDTALAKQALALALTKEPGPTLSASIINGVSGDHPDLAVDFALANREAVEALVDVSSKSEFIPGLGNGSSDPAMVGKLEAYAKAYLSPESRKPVDQSIAAIQTRIKSQPRIRTETSAWLDEKAGQ
ncbi:M1 family peptidase [Sphingorhabdus sp. IMCC26285]|uniref:Aminopeptidase n=1 Tax=Sphingorhabdus profundilacus TaxID=2509718 RepID=A0A6I4M165_9SPHN|nr:M1 family metallopeptidase [Sphingorhabdus profundilacus]MVZ96168.1 M1 family peptidase [Sphingorhabdus profundilacus]